MKEAQASRQMILELLLYVALSVPDIPPDNDTAIAIERIEKLTPGFDLDDGVITIIPRKQKIIWEY